MLILPHLDQKVTADRLLVFLLPGRQRKSRKCLRESAVNK